MVYVLAALLLLTGCETYHGSERWKRDVAAWEAQFEVYKQALDGCKKAENWDACAKDAKEKYAPAGDNPRWTLADTDPGPYQLPYQPVAQGVFILNMPGR
jgi:hypothetical protein